MSQQNQAPVHHAPLPFHKQIIAGGTAGIIETLAMYPTDVLKTRAQLSTESLSMIKCIRDISAKEGFGTFYRGISAPLLAEGPKRAVKFSTNETYKHWLSSADGKLSNIGAITAGTMAGITEATCNCPFEVIKIRMQAVDGKALYTSTMDCAMKVLNNEGVFRGLYKGFEAQMWRNGVWNGTYFGMIGSARNMIPIPHDATKKDRVIHSLLAGSAAGSLASCLNIPFDVAKSRIQNQKPGQVKYKWALPTVVTIAKEEGVRNLYKGLAPKLVRLGPGGGIMVVVFDQVSEWIR